MSQTSAKWMSAGSIAHILSSFRNERVAGAGCSLRHHSLHTHRPDAAHSQGRSPRAVKTQAGGYELPPQSHHAPASR
jgi:hypothetical protein